MKTMWLVALALVLFVGAGQAQETQPPPVLRIVNHSGQKVDVNDGAYRLASVLQGETRVVDLTNPVQETRRLTVHSFAWTTQTEAEQFKQRGYELVIEENGQTFLTLWVPK